MSRTSLSLKIAGEYLPEELIIRIFERLPIKPLIRFTSLSKRWRFIILSDPHFAKSQFQIASEHHTLNRRILFLNYGGPHEPHKPESIPLPVEFECHDDLGDNNSCSYLRELPCPFSPPDHWFFGMCSCNGLVCLKFHKSISIWNPSTRFYRILPQVPHENDCTYYIESFGFGHVSSFDDYKVFVVIIEQSKSDSQLEYWKSYTWSLSGNIWKKVARPNFNLGWKRKSTLSNESLHWLVEDRIVAFYLTKEEFRTMPLPISTDGWDNNVGCRFKYLCASLGGSLCLLDIHNYSFAELWVLREYGVTNSWTKQFSFKIPETPSELVLVMETSILVLTKGGQLKLIRCDHEEVGELGIRTVCENKGSTDMIEYQETLLSPYMYTAAGHYKELPKIMAEPSSQNRRRKVKVKSPSYLRMAIVKEVEELRIRTKAKVAVIFSEEYIFGKDVVQWYLNEKIQQRLVQLEQDYKKAEAELHAEISREEELERRYEAGK